MSILSNNNKFLVLVLALVASTLVVEAGGVRSRREDRNLKTSKSKGSKSGYYSGTTAVDADAKPSSIVINPPVVENANSVAGFGQNCSPEGNDLSRCVKRNFGTDLDIESCKMCLVGISNMKGEVTRLNVNSCSNVNINGGLCKECYGPALDYYNCGADTDILADIDVNPNAGVVTGGGGSTTGGSTTGGSTTVTMPAAASYAPIEVCPTAPQKSGNQCDTDGFTYLKCFYPGLKCTCRQDSPVFLCNPYDPSNPH